MEGYKRCAGCSKKKPLSEFSIRAASKGRRASRVSRCKDCMRDYHRDHYYKTREVRTAKKRATSKRVVERNALFVVEHLRKNPCVDCGESDIVVLDLDHRDDEKKVANVCDMVRGRRSLAAIEKEIAKCDVRCANCHRRKTARTQSWLYK